MAQPPLEYQIEHAARILICRTVREPGGFAYEILETLKGSPAPSTLRLNTKIFELLGYVPSVGQQVAVFLEGETLAVGRSSGWGILATVFGCLAILGISLPAGILLIVRTALGRRSLPSRP